MRLVAPVAALVAAACVPVVASDRAPSEVLAAGERAYQRCYSCHALAADVAGADGPHLGGVVGRPIAAVPGYPYSAVLRAYAVRERTWSKEGLDAFLADPESEVPGNTMGFFGIEDPTERAALIEWLSRRR